MRRIKTFTGMPVAACLFSSSVLLSACGGGSSSEPSSSGVDSGMDQPTTPQLQSINGAGVKGPLAFATVNAYAPDFAQSDLKGELLGTGNTSAAAAIENLSIAADYNGALVLEFVVNGNTIDISSNAAPAFQQLLTYVSASQFQSLDAVYASVLTTMTFELALANADSAAPYSGNGDNSVSQTEFEAALAVAQSQVKTSLGFGLDDSVDIFTTPPLLTDDTDSTEEITAVVAYRQANEMVAAVTLELASQSTTNQTADELLDGLVEDLSDGELDGNSDEGEVEALQNLDDSIDVVLANIDVEQLTVPGTDTLISDIESLIADEAEQTEADVDTTALEDGSLAVDVDNTLDSETNDDVSDDDGSGVVDEPVDDGSDSDQNDDGQTDDGSQDDGSDSDQNDDGQTDDGAGDDQTDDGQTDSDQDGNDDGQNDDGQSDDDSGDDSGGSSGGSIIIITPDPGTSEIDNGLTYDPGSSGEHIPVSESGVIVFELEGDQTLNVGEVLKNPANSVNSGRIRFSSSDSGVVSVDINGTLMAHQAGSAQISAERSNNGNIYSYNVVVQPAVHSADFWVGTSDTIIEPHAGSEGISLMTHSEAGCDTNAIAQCTNGAADTLTSAGLTTKAITLDQTGFHSVNGQLLSQEQGLGSELWEGRSNGRLESFNGKMWLIGGADVGSPTEPFGDVWASDDGYSWAKITDDAPFGPRYKHSTAVHDGKLWLIGGHDGSADQNDVWYTEDGIEWTQIPNAEFSARRDAQLISFNDKLWLIGGNNKTDVWSSSDGSDWVEEADNAFPASFHSNAFVFDDAIWLIMPSTVSLRVWRSEDGATWHPRTASIPPNISWGNYVVHDDLIYVMAGTYAGFRNLVWVSRDGDNYERVSATENEVFRERYLAQAVSHNGRVWLMGGNASVGSINDVHSTTDGSRWHFHNFASYLPSRVFGDLVEHDGGLTLVGGLQRDRKDSIWHTVDGKRWQKINDDASYEGRFYSESYSKNGNLFMTGGLHGETEIWMSEDDGVTWSLETDDAAFGERRFHRVVEFNDQLWMIGGDPATGFVPHSDIWRSDDGLTWSLAVSEAPFAARYSAGVVVFDDKLWVFGGIGQSSVGLTDVWSSVDGINWTQESTNGGFGSGNAEMSAALEDRMIVIDSDGNVAYSDNGVNWTQSTVDSGLPEWAYGADVIAYDGYFWLNGGPVNAFRGNYDSAMWRSADGINWRAYVPVNWSE